MTVIASRFSKAWRGASSSRLLDFVPLSLALIAALIVAAALLFGALSAGALEIDLFTEVPRELMLVVQAAILLLVVAGDGLFRAWLTGRLHSQGGAHDA